MIATRDGQAITISPEAAQRLEQLAAALLVSSTYEAPSTIATEERWSAALRASHVSITFSEPRTFTFAYSPPQLVSAQQILIPTPADHAPDYILVRFHDRIRAFAKFSCEADTAFRRAIPSAKTQ